MKRLAILLTAWLLLANASLAAFTEFYCNHSTGSNMNGGSDENTSPSYSATNGGWNSGTGVFTPASGDPSASVTVGQYAHVFTDGSTTPTFIGRVTAVSSTTVTVSTTVKSGTAPTTAGTGISINVGGVWKGPNGSSGFPFNFAVAPMRPSDDAICRINLKNNATYDVTATITGATDVGPMVYEGYTTTPGDDGVAKIDGGGTGTRYILFTNTNYTGKRFRRIWFTRNGGSSTTQNLVVSTGTNTYEFCRFSHSSGGGASGGVYLNCEFHSNGGFGAVPSTAKRCIAHNNGTIGFDMSNSGQWTLVDCIAHNNGTIGFYYRSTASRVVTASGLDAYENTGDGFRIQRDGGNFFNLILENCNSIKNGGYGIGCQGSNPATISLRKFGYGAGTAANTSGTFQTSSFNQIIEDTSFNYPSNDTPWVDPENGDFRINHADAKNAGYGEFLQDSGLYSGGTIGYPDVGAAQHQDAGGGALNVPTFNTLIQ